MSAAEVSTNAEERPIEEIETEICTLAGQIAAATAQFLFLLADFDARRGWAGWQLHSCAHWLSWKAGVGLHTAREQVRIAGTLTKLPRIAAAFAAGTLSYSKVRALTRVATERTEESLLRLALESPAAHLDRLCRGLKRQTRQPADPDHCTGRWRYDDDGYHVLTARFRPEDGARFLAALTRAECERARTGDTEPDLTAPAPPNPVPAMLVMAEMVCGSTDSPVVSPAAEVIVHVGDQDNPGAAPAHLDDGPGIDAQTVAQLLCTATLRLVKHGRLGQTIEWGHAHRRPTRMQLRHLVIRDRCCAVPGCGRTRFLHAHHVKFVSHGGATTLDNLGPLCLLYVPAGQEASTRWHVVWVGTGEVTHTGLAGTLARVAMSTTPGPIRRKADKGIALPSTTMGVTSREREYRQRQVRPESR